MEWMVRLDGDDTGLQDLAESFNMDPKIFEEDGNYYLWSSDFDQCTDSSDVKEKSEELLKTIRNFGEQQSLWVEDLCTGEIHELGEEGTSKIHLHLEAETIEIRSRTQASVVGGGDGKKNPASEKTEKWTKQALHDRRAAEVVDLLENGYSWVNMYRIYEFIQDNIHGDRNIVERGWWTSGEESLFRQTANSREAIGNEARHGKDQTDGKPTEPMDQSEAKHLIQRLIEEWMEHRIEQS